MNEMIIEHPIMGISEGYILIVFSLIMVLANYYFWKWRVRSNVVLIKRLKKIAIIITVAFAIFFVSIGRNQILYLFDYNFENTNEVEEYIEYVAGNNQGIFIVSSDDARYHFMQMDKELREKLETDYCRHNCYIEYYTWSKYVIKIEVIE